MERVRTVAREFLPWVALMGFGGIAVIGDVGVEMRQLLLQWGPGLLIFLVIAQHAPALVRSQQRQADAMTSQATALGMQATALTAVARELQELPRRDDLKFQDLAVGQDLILRELGEIKKRLPE